MRSDAALLPVPCSLKNPKYVLNKVANRYQYGARGLTLYPSG
ncbi:hypothetical protein [Moorena sp. SIO4G3]|nr:hypothetical protein [Moorena sp. SIO4G3]